MMRCRLLGALILTALCATLLAGCVFDEQAPPDGNAIDINLTNTAVVDTAPTASSGVASPEIKVAASEPAETHAPSPTTIASQAPASSRAADAMNTSTPTATHTPNPTIIPIPTPAFSRAAATINTYTPTSIPITTPPAQSDGSSASPSVGTSRRFSLERNIEWRDIIARVRLLSTATRVENVITRYKGLEYGSFFVVFLEFEFEVLEYLMGDGNSIVWGVLYDLGGAHETEQEALDSAPAVRSTHNSLYSQWNDREYIVFMKDIAAKPESEVKGSMDMLAIKGGNRYAIGAWVPHRGVDYYSIKDIDGKFWLPAAASASGASGASAGEQSFLLDVPAVSGASGEAAVRQVSISELKRLIAKHVAETQDGAATATPTQAVATSTPTASPTPQQSTATVVPTATPTNTPATAPTATPTPAPTLTPTPPAGGVSGAIDTPTPTPTSTPTATTTHTPTIAPTATATPDGSGNVVSGQ